LICEAFVCKSWVIYKYYVLGHPQHLYQGKKSLVWKIPTTRPTGKSVNIWNPGHMYSNYYILLNFHTNESFTIQELPRSICVYVLYTYEQVNIYIYINVYMCIEIILLTVLFMCIFLCVCTYIHKYIYIYTLCMCVYSYI